MDKAANRNGNGRGSRRTQWAAVAAAPAGAYSDAAAAMAVVPGPAWPGTASVGRGVPASSWARVASGVLGGPPPPPARVIDVAVAARGGGRGAGDARVGAGRGAGAGNARGGGHRGGGRGGRNTAGAYRPMNQATDGPRPLTAEEVALREERGVPKNYRGSVKERKVPVPADVNCAVWIPGLPFGTTIKDVFNALRKNYPMGRVANVSLMPGATERLSPGVRIVFFKHAPALALHTLGNGPAGFHVNGKRVKEVLWDRIGALEQPEGRRGNFHTRVLYIDGPRDIANISNIRTLIEANIVYQTDKVGEYYAGDRGTVVWAFAKFSGQAQAAAMVLRKKYIDMPEVTVLYGEDDCGMI
ncbi:hypothetical protein B0T24DRAFT_692324 [Lasiosphaeria ovina]|uniref:Uncharacterized protein n=1 Tax=Lasiosphaeria ovina TaxID=92902 RepID=A0AAE0JTL4_9PEZI|nr:hypothetical protein B0T24DRAFT_692324 [Lasiosphaeria ovina]